jgi:hypothetical protein
MSTEEPEFQQVLICLARTSEQFQQMARTYRHKSGMETAKFSFSLKSYPDREFYASFNISMDDSMGNFVEWDLDCVFDKGWRVILDIFLLKNVKNSESETIFSFPEPEISSASDLIQALDTAVADTKTSIESRDISSWVELSKT